MQSSFLVHPIPPLYDKDSRVLILGSFPSPKSREAQFFYGHPQNRFWKVMVQVLDWRGEGSGGLPGQPEGSRALPVQPAGGNPQPAGGFSQATDGPVIVPATVEEKRTMLLSNHIALWDTIASCEITGASDASITNVTPNDLSPILEAAKIRAIFCNGAASHKLYIKYIYPASGREAVKLPSTSPANAAWSVEKLIKSWREILPYLQE